jgi:hypothetical protein
MDLLFWRSRIGSRSVNDWVAALTGDTQDSRRRWQRRLVDTVKGDDKSPAIRKGLASLIKQLSSGKPGVAGAIGRKQAQGGMWLHFGDQHYAHLRSDKLIRDLDITLNALESELQGEVSVSTACAQCHNPVQSKTRECGVALKCSCGAAVPAGRWLFNTLGKPVAVVQGEGVFLRSGRCLGSIEGHEIWSDTYGGEIVLDDRLVRNIVRQGHRNRWTEFSTPGIPVLPPDKPKLDSSLEFGIYGEFKPYYDHYLDPKRYE